MAESVADTLQNSGQLVVEAGTGTGKTFAYLLPAMQSGKKTIISTGTKALQDQLFHRDLPLISKAVGRPVTTALLKGRANYLCMQRLDTPELAGFPSGGLFVGGGRRESLQVAPRRPREREPRRSSRADPWSGWSGLDERRPLGLLYLGGHKEENHSR